MNKRSRSLLGIFALTLFWTGCVSQQSYQSVVQQFERERQQNEQLRKENDQLKADAVKIKEEAARLTGDNQSLLKSAQEDKTRADDLSAQIENLSRENKVLLKKKGVLRQPNMAWSKGMADAFQKTFQEEIRKGEAQVKPTQDRLTFILAESLLFDEDDVEITQEGEDVLAKLGEVLSKAKGRQIVIGSHLDDAPIAASMARDFPTAWEFTGTRAVAVVRFLQEESKINGRTLTAAAYGSTRPIAGNTTDSGRAQNRRLEVTLLP
ncbi:MAG TPA: OmpA family protein [Nitrospiria bacterium]|nr:OmpA family protein [Nitrospiria bacterium]